MGFENIRKALDGVELPGMVVQSILTEQDEYLIRTSASDVDTEAVKHMVAAALEENIPGAKVDIRRTEMVGPKVSADLRSKALEAHVLRRAPDHHLHLGPFRAALDGRSGHGRGPVRGHLRAPVPGIARGLADHRGPDHLPGALLVHETQLRPGGGGGIGP